MIGFTPSDEQRDLKELARTFARREFPALAAAADAGEPGAAGADAYRAMFAKAAEIGLQALMLPPEVGGSGGTCLDNVLVQEELGAVDVGLGGSINLNAGIPLMIAAGAGKEQASAWLREICESRDHILSGALNEPDVAGSEIFSPLDDPALGVRLRAVRDGDEYVLDGAKAAFVTNASVAKAFMVFGRTDRAKGPMEGTSVFYVPADTPGVGVGPPTRLLGMRASWHAEVVFDGVRVPASRRIGPEGGGLQMMGAAAAPMALGLAAGFVGLARSALEAAVTYAKQRMSSGRPIASHQAVALHLADMDIDVRSARLMVWHAADVVDRLSPEGPRLVQAAKAHAVDAAIRVAGRAVKVHGGYGVAQEYPVEKLLRDAWTGWSCDFTGDMLRLDVAAQL